MAEESFLLVSLKDEKAKKLSQVIGNKTARRILDFLAKKKHTESELSKELGLPMSTIHYNLKHLEAAGLVRAKEYHYSSKGKEVLHYELVNKLIIISPETETGNVADLLKKFLPVTVAVGAISLAMQFFQKSPVIARDVVEEAAPLMAKMAVQESADAAAGAQLAMAAPEVLKAEPNIALWFFIGAMAVVLAMFFIEFVKRKK